MGQPKLVQAACQKFHLKMIELSRKRQPISVSLSRSHQVSPGLTARKKIQRANPLKRIVYFNLNCISVVPI